MERKCGAVLQQKKTANARSSEKRFSKMIFGAAARIVFVRRKTVPTGFQGVLYDFSFHPCAEGLPLHDGTGGLGEGAGIWSAPAQVVVAEGGLVNAPLHKELFTSVIFFDPER